MTSSRPSVPPDRVSLPELGWLALIVFLPLVPLLVPDGCFGRDWVSHLWLTSYYAEYFKQHLAFPEVINTTQLAGMPFPVFYGALLYPYLGVPGAWVGAAGAMRCLIAAVFFLQSWQVFKLTRQVAGDRTLGLVVAAVTCWSTYALTNLYNRGAFAELIAVALLTAAIGALGRVFLLPPANRRAGDVASGLLCFVLAAGTHSITALCGGLFIAFLVMVLFLLAEQRSELVRWGLLGGVAGILVLGPWAYVVASFGREVLVAKEGAREMAYLEVDSAGSRLMPFPYDRRVWENPELPLEQAPHLDAQVNSSLLLLALVISAVAVLLRRQRVRLYRPGARAMVIFWLLFLFLFAVSVTPSLGAKLPLFRNIQYAYRLVSYLNLCLLLVVISGLGALATTDWRKRVERWRLPVLLFIVAVAVIGLGIKLRHGTERAFVVRDLVGAGGVQMPRGFFGWRDYAIFTRVAASDPPDMIVNIPVGVESGFGDVRALRFVLPSAGLVEIRVQPFPWNEVKVDGRAIMAAAGTLHTEEGIFLPLAAGVHDVEYRWNPDPLWRWLNRISRTVLFLWVLLVLGLAWRSALGSRAKPVLPVP